MNVYTGETTKHIDCKFVPVPIAFKLIVYQISIEILVNIKSKLLKSVGRCIKYRIKSKIITFPLMNSVCLPVLVNILRMSSNLYMLSRLTTEYFILKNDAYRINGSYTETHKRIIIHYGLWKEKI